MRLGARLHWPLGLLVLLLLAGCDDKPATPTESGAEPQQDSAAELGKGGDDEGKGTQIPFEDAEVFFELNTTDNDLGLQVLLDAEGWTKVRVSDPEKQKIVQIMTEGNLSDLGITELRFESAEPSPAEVLALFPAGDYEFRGKTIEGDRLVSTATLSHDFPAALTFSPSDGQVVNRDNTVVEWNAPGAEGVEVIIENADLGQVFDVTVPGSTTSLDVPPQFLTPGTEYTIELLAIADNGNRTIAQSTFATTP